MLQLRFEVLTVVNIKTKALVHKFQVPDNPWIINFVRCHLTFVGPLSMAVPSCHPSDK